MSLGMNVFRNKRRRKKSRGNIRHLGINVAQSKIPADLAPSSVKILNF